jgi:hypothetical protein
MAVEAEIALLISYKNIVIWETPSGNLPVSFLL